MDDFQGVGTRPMLSFTKMHGTGNDFMVIDCTHEPLCLSPAQIRRMADRHFGIGFDQLLLVEPPDCPDVDFRYRIFNADGTEVGQCGNGARCFARFVRDRGLCHKDCMRVRTTAGIIELHLTSYGAVVVDMGVPKLEPADVPFLATHGGYCHEVEVDGRRVELTVVGMGNPHAVLFVDAVDTAPVSSLGPSLTVHPRFPERVNVGFAQVVSRDVLRLRVFERGAGETLACGSGACAAVVAGCLRGLLDARVTVRLPGGDVRIEWADRGGPVLLEGSATPVYEGRWLWPPP